TVIRSGRITVGASSTISNGCRVTASVLAWYTSTSSTDSGAPSRSRDAGTRKLPPRTACRTAPLCERCGGLVVAEDGGQPVEPVSSSISEVAPQTQLGANPLWQGPRTHARQPNASRARHALALSTVRGGARLARPLSAACRALRLFGTPTLAVS